MGKGSIITLVVLVALVVGGMFVWKGVQRSRTEAEAREAPRKLLAFSMVYKENRDYLDGLIREAHGAAFEKAYNPGSLFAPSEWDEQVYVEHVFDAVAARVLADGKPEMARDLPGVHEKPEGYEEPIIGGGGKEGQPREEEEAPATAPSPGGSTRP